MSLLHSVLIGFPLISFIPWVSTAETPLTLIWKSGISREMNGSGNLNITCYLVITNEMFNVYLRFTQQFI